MKSNNHYEITRNQKNLLSNYLIRTGIWFLFCPSIALILFVLERTRLLHIYEGFLLIFGIICFLSEFFNRSTWWDQESIDMQLQIKKEAKDKWGIFHIRPILLGIPCFIVVLILEIPRIRNFL